MPHDGTRIGWTIASFLPAATPRSSCRCTSHPPNRHESRWDDESCACPRHCTCSLLTKIGFARIDKQFIPPRTWHMKNLIDGWRAEPIVEFDTMLMPDHFYRPVWRFAGDTLQDHRHFYSREGMALLALGLGGHAILANTRLDEDFRRQLQSRVDWTSMEWARYTGETWVVAPALAAVWIADNLVDHDRWFDRRWGLDLGDWSSQSLRALMVGAPVVGTMQALIGASRPGESPHGSRWRPFNDNNGVSGHAFVGAVPFLVAARHTDSLLLKSAFCAVAAFPGYARLHSDRHYLSQVLLGWGIAYLAVEATELTEQSSLQVRVVPLNLDGLVGIGLECRR